MVRVAGFDEARVERPDLGSLRETLEQLDSLSSFSAIAQQLLIAGKL